MCEKFPNMQEGDDGPDPFDLDSIRAKPEDYGTITTKKLPDEMPIGRPDSKEYIRCIRNIIETSRL
jgi:hypothetical protein